jgi:integrase
MSMGRKPTRWTNLPKGMRARPRGNLVHYYLDTGAKPRKEIPLGSDYVTAVATWAALTSRPAPVEKAAPTFIDALEGYTKLDGARVSGYRVDVLPMKAPRTQQDNEKELAWLLKFFGDPPAPLGSIEATHIRQYMRWRVKAARAAAEEKNAERRQVGRPEMPIAADLGHVRANREKALFSHVWNYARQEGLTNLQNPCAGVQGFEEEGRDASPDDVLVGRVLAHADKPLEFAMRLADIIGQRPADNLKVAETDIEGDVPGGILKVRQGKTRAKLRIMIIGALADLVLELRAYKRAITDERRAAGKPVLHTLALLVNDKGEALTKSMLRSRFDEARVLAGVKKDIFQFRDFRAKVATQTDEAEGTRAAQALLGHTTENMTVRYIRHKSGKIVRPSK